MRYPQITAHVPASVHERFRRYAEGLGLRDSEVAKLLVLREKKIRRIKTGLALAPRKPTAARALKSITAHMSSKGQVADFHAYARGCKLTRSAAAALLFTKELDERWLEKAISRS
ncbi:hypothetical protein NLM16_16700 [Bradyrhizobium brasilense]|uniref:hypothetical protein n=1 Tax=Bradyrhizobium brasilense TaxID=1419277 RepID=UPI0028774590|nr:hypothetical protein [Bradyrhizobium brasilense]MCP3415740.1 hypothetical protein [Bradyrhizobium brasilense]